MVFDDKFGKHILWESNLATCQFLSMKSKKKKRGKETPETGEQSADKINSNFFFLRLNVLYEYVLVWLRVCAFVCIRYFDVCDFSLFYKYFCSMSILFYSLLSASAETMLAVLRIQAHRYKTKWLIYWASNTYNNI